MGEAVKRGFVGEDAPLVDDGAGLKIDAEHLVAVVLLSGVVAKETRHYLASPRALEETDDTPVPTITSS